MMTTMAAFFGMLPIALGLGTGAEARRPPGLAVVGGLVLSQSLTHLADHLWRDPAGHHHTVVEQEGVASAHRLRVHTA